MYSLYSIRKKSHVCGGVALLAIVAFAAAAALVVYRSSRSAEANTVVDSQAQLGSAFLRPMGWASDIFRPALTDDFFSPSLYDWDDDFLYDDFDVIDAFDTPAITWRTDTPRIASWRSPRRFRKLFRNRPRGLRTRDDTSRASLLGNTPSTANLRQHTTDDAYLYKLPVDGFPQNCLGVRVDNNIVRLSGAKVCRDEKAGSASAASFDISFTVPNDAKMEEVSSVYDPRDYTLCVKVNRQRPLPKLESGSGQVPIQIERRAKAAVAK
mmetsp:Transcript_7286/g.13625  ORF Transcript_7286/g.13625 Transcript_7286/m.13625 type:complete len:267 (+) Transcript_7286:165-965(+)|eukprot:CAMPEP_0197528312 /NCGR_PEP_ID=MMETSP1318-20131121/24652_1 /TAXON_ID=552666 /ORGANISM="Partenskyella glossopodia, Strain RCC365" /LENGTH=266 /DNA_ID=CAMNT_0043083357 /DNA_START=129 /DNA_END=929 /DNA_ORIENTATION=+